MSTDKLALLDGDFNAWYQPTAKAQKAFPAHQVHVGFVSLRKSVMCNTEWRYVTAGANMAFSAGQDLHAIAQGNHATVAKDGVVLYTYGIASDSAKPNTETGIALHAASGTVVASSNTGATRLTSSGAIDVTSTKTNVLVASPRQITLAAAGAAIQIEAGNITINAPGSVEFKAGMKNLTSAAAASGPDLDLATAALQPVKHYLRFAVRSALGEPLANKPYALLMSDGTIKSGTTDGLGYTEQVVTDRPETVHLYVEDADHEGYLVDQQ